MTETRDDGFARLYAALAMVIVPWSFLPIYDDVVEQDGSGIMSRDYGSVWEMAGRGNSGIDVLGIVLIGVLVALLTTAAFRTRSPALPVAIAILAVLLAVLLVTKPETSDPAPPLSDAGAGGVALACCTVVLAVVHALVLSVRRRAGTAPTGG